MIKLAFKIRITAHMLWRMGLTQPIQAHQWAQYKSPAEQRSVPRSKGQKHPHPRASPDSRPPKPSVSPSFPRGSPKSAALGKKIRFAFTGSHRQTRMKLRNIHLSYKYPESTSTWNPLCRFVSDPNSPPKRRKKGSLLFSLSLSIPLSIFPHFP